MRTPETNPPPDTRFGRGNSSYAVAPSRWAAAWPDLLAFLGGLALAWFARWETTDLVWSLWLSSLVVGYAIIVGSIFGPPVWAVLKAWQERTTFAGTPVPSASPAALGGAAALFLGGIFLLAFFTVHFGMFHFVHGMFLQSFFPVAAEKSSFAINAQPHLANFLEVLRRYWIFLPMAFLAERQAFRFTPPHASPPDTAVTPEAIAARKARNAKQSGMNGLMAPYKNVIRLHLLIFFFAAAHFAKLDHFLVYAVVYAVYFFPWRLLRREKTAPVPTAV